MSQDLLARLKFPPRRFRRLALFALWLPTLWFSWGVRTQGCNVDTPVALRPPVSNAAFANPEMAWVLVVALVWLLAPIGIERVAGHGRRALLNVASAVAAGLLAMFALVAVFAETLFGKLLAVSVAGALGMTCLGALVLEAWSWVMTDIASAWRRRKALAQPPGSAPGTASEVVVADRVPGEEGRLPADGDALEDEAGRV